MPGYVYPEDGSILRIGSADARVIAQPSVSSSAQAGVGALAVSLFGGEITIDSIDVRTSVAAGPANASGNVSAATMTGLTVLGQLITPSANAVVPLADWGSLELLASLVETVQEPPRSATATVTAIRVKLIADHGGLPAGSTIEIGTVSTTATAAPVVRRPAPVRSRATTPTTRLPTGDPAERAARARQVDSGRARPSSFAPRPR